MHRLRLPPTDEHLSRNLALRVLKRFQRAGDLPERYVHPNSALRIRVHELGIDASAEFYGVMYVGANVRDFAGVDFTYRKGGTPPAISN